MLWTAESNAHRILQMQDYTTPDIEDFIRKLLGADECFQRRREQNSDFDNLAKQLIDRAEGVWLWAERAVSHVCISLENGKSMEEIKEKVDNLPDLDGLYQRDLEAIDDDCKGQAAQIFLMSLDANEAILMVTLILAGYLTDRSSSALFMLSSDSIASKTQLEAMLSKPSRIEERRKKEFGGWTEEEIQKVIKSQKEALEARCQDFMKVRRSTGNDSAAVAIRDRLVFSHRTCRGFLARKHPDLRKVAHSTFEINEALLKAFSLNVQFIPTQVDGKGTMFRVLTTNILYCAAQHQLSKGDTQASSLEWIPDVASDDVKGIDFMKLLLSKEQADVGALEDSDASSASSVEAPDKPKKTRKLDGLRKAWSDTRDAWNVSMDEYYENSHADDFQDFSSKQMFVRMLLLESSTPKRIRLQSACQEADKTTSLWTTLHVVPLLILLTDDETNGLKRQRGRSSTWGCWLQMFLTAPRNLYPHITKELRRLTVMLIENGANPEYVLRHHDNGEGGFPSTHHCPPYL